MLKTSKFRAIRNIPVGWMLQALHSTDLSDRLFRLWIESILILCLFILLRNENLLISFLTSFCIIHSITWLTTGSILVYMLDSFRWVRNPGINKIIEYISDIEASFSRLDCCDTILIYGSMCRQEFHMRSDLDLRILRRADSKKGILCLAAAYYFRIKSLFRLIPVDLQVVDSMDFLQSQMRDDERPILVLRRNGIVIKNEGFSFSEIKNNPQVVLRNETRSL